MNDADKTFLRDLLAAPGTSSFESKPAAVWRERATSMDAAVSTDSYGNSFATFNPNGAIKVMLAGHVDEIGLIITYIDEHGFLYFSGVGGWDSQQLVGQRVRVVGYKSELVGVIGKKPIHLMKREDASKVSKIEDMWIDIGAKDGSDAKQHVRVGDFAVIEQPFLELLNGRVASKAIDNRIGAYIVLEVAKQAAAENADAQVVAVATVQEEIGGIGAYVASHSLEPHVAIAIDVTHASDIPSVDKKRTGESPFGSGPQFSVGSYVHRGVLNKLIEAAEAESMSYSLASAPAYTSTDADDIAKNRSGVPTAVVSIPNRYMHSPSEMIDLADVDSIVQILVAFIKRLSKDEELTQPL
ncbi:MAG: M42 family metallopeptidase [Deinococcota bacterium]